VDLTISPQIKIVAVAGIVAVLAAVVGLRMLGSGSSPAAAPPAKTYPHLGAGGKVVAAPATAAKTTKPAIVASAKKTTAKSASAKKSTTAPAKAKTHATAVPAATPATTPAPAATTPAAPTAPASPASNLPLPLANLLERHDVVVVSIYNPQAPTDAIAYAEARAGAELAGAGFLGVNVLDPRVTGPLTTAIGNGLLPDPGVLVYHRPGTLATRVDGFLDRDAVAQAASNAALSAQP
jgi:hypothetical protein